jgi:hypothetical protein
LSRRRRWDFWPFDRREIDLTDLENSRARTDAGRQDATLQETHIGCRRSCEGAHCESRSRAAAKSSREQVSGAQAQHIQPRRTHPGPGYREDSTGTLPGVPQRSPEPCRHRSAAPSSCRADAGARRQAICDIAGNLAVARDNLIGIRPRRPGHRARRAPLQACKA